LALEKTEKDGTTEYRWTFNVQHSNNGTILYRRVLEEYSRDSRFICEIGTGVSTSIFRENVKKLDGHIWTIDVRNRPAVTNSITYISGDSTFMMWSREIDLLYIDGDHSAETVWKELLIYSSGVKEGGIILMDDVRHEGTVSKFLPDDLEVLVKKFCWLHGVKWEYCADAPNKIACIFVHKKLGSGL